MQADLAGNDFLEREVDVGSDVSDEDNGGAFAGGVDGCRDGFGAADAFEGDVDTQRLALAKKLGATEILLSDDSLLARILERTSNEGVDVALECVGRNETVAASIDATRKGGTVVLVGNIAPNVNLPLQKVVTRQIRLQGSCASAGEYPQAIEWMASGKIQVKPLITAIAPLEEGPRWFERLHAREPNLLKVVLTPNAS